MTASLPDWRASYTRALNTAAVCGACRFAPEAAREWDDIYPGLSTTSGLLGAIVARAAPEALRLSAIYAALDRDSDPGEVTLPHLHSALAVVRFWRDARDGSSAAS